MSILDREREIAHTQNQIKHSTCTVYTASPEELEKLLNGRNGMGRTKGSKNKPHDITVNEKRQALQSKIEKQKNERKEKQNEIFENFLSLPNECQPISEPPHAATQIIGSIEIAPIQWLTLNEKVEAETDNVNDVESTEDSAIHKQCMETLKGQYKMACSGAAHSLIFREIDKISSENAVEVLSNIIEIAITFRKEFLVK